MKRCLLLLVTFYSAFLYSQSTTNAMKPINFGECDMNGMFISAQTMPEWGCDSIGLIDYMNRNVKDSMLVKVKEGRVLVGFLIYPDGKTCCSSLLDMTQSHLDAVLLKDAINRMPNWRPGTQNGKNVKCLQNLVLRISNGKFVNNP